jgi:hypothetical protein
VGAVCTGAGTFFLETLFTAFFIGPRFFAVTVAVFGATVLAATAFFRVGAAFFDT